MIRAADAGADADVAWTLDVDGARSTSRRRRPTSRPRRAERRRRDAAATRAAGRAVAPRRARVRVPRDRARRPRETVVKAAPRRRRSRAPISPRPHRSCCPTTARAPTTISASLLARDPGRERRAHRLARQGRARSRCAARTPIRCASTSTACRSTSPPAAASTCRRCRSATSSASRSTAAARRSSSASRRWAASSRSRRARRAPRARARAPAAGSFGTMFGDVSGGGRVGRLRLYVGVHGFSAQGDFPYLNDNGTAFNTADDVTMPRQNNDVQQGDGVLRAGADARGPAHARPRRARLRARRGAAGRRPAPDGQRALPDDARPRLPALRVARRSRAPAAGCPRSCTRRCSATG